MKVEQQSQRHVERSHPTQQLRLVYRHDILDGLKLDKKAPVYQQIEPQCRSEDGVLVVDYYLSLAHCGYLSKLELSQHASLVDALQEPRTHDPAHFDCGTDDLA
jgi:hypothetical protein